MIPPYPLVQKISFLDPLTVFNNVKGEGAVFLDSATANHPQGKYSFIGVDPFQMLICAPGDSHDPFQLLAQSLARFPLARLPAMPPFQGGAAGMLSYELGSYCEKLPPLKKDDLGFPVLMMGLYDLVLAWDHTLNQAWVFSSGYPANNEAERIVRAQQRLEWVLKHLKKCKSLSQLQPAASCGQPFTSTFNQENYELAVKEVIEYIRAGDIFEANISQRFTATTPPKFCAFDLYRRLRINNPAPFAAFMQYQQWTIASASPERFLRLAKGKVQTRPIKGTRPRHIEPQQDRLLAQELLASEKDRAENIMIVDLMRNDLSRVCLPHTVLVPQLCGLESYATVHHLVSVVEGQLDPNLQAVDLLQATFPGGSITGAPKIRAMEIIAELEPTVRGPYCGSMGYMGFNGEMDLSIIIRTFAMRHDQVTFQAGGAITVDSDPATEYEETLNKIKVLSQTLNEAINVC